MISGGFQGRGYNTGVILVDIKKLRDMKWFVIWKEIIRKYSTEFKSTYLADQVS